MFRSFILSIITLSLWTGFGCTGLEDLTAAEAGGEPPAHVSDAAAGKDEAPAEPVGPSTPGSPDAAPPSSLGEPAADAAPGVPPAEGDASEAALRIPVNPPPTKLEVFRTDRVVVESDPRNGGTDFAFGLRWIDAGGEQEYSIEQRFRFLEQTSLWQEVGRARANSTSAFVVVSALGFQFLEFRVIAHNFPGRGPGAESNIAGILAGLTFPRGFAFPAPSRLSATGFAVGKVRLQWSDNHHNEPDDIVYQVEQSTGTGDFLAIAALPPNHDSLTLEGLPVGSNLTFRVRSVPLGRAAERGLFVPSDYSNEAAVRVPTFAPGLSQPTNLRATVVSSSQINLQWDDNSDNEGIFIVSMGTSADQQTDMFAVARNVTTRQITGLDASTRYFFQVRARNDAGDSGRASADATTLDASTPPAAPSECLATTLDRDLIELRWRDNSNNEAAFVIENSIDGGATFQEYFVGGTEIFINRDPADPDVIVVADEDLPAGTQFCYRIRARNPGGTSAPSNVSCATTLAANATTVRVINQTAYPVQTLTVNGSELLPGNLILPPGFFIAVPVAAGTVQVQAQTVLFDGGVEIPMYPYLATATAASGQTVDVTLDNPSLGQLLTGFTNAQYTWEALMIVGDLSTVFLCDFFPNGEYRFSGTAIETGTTSLLSYPGDGTVLFRMDTSGTQALLLEVPDDFGHRHILMALLDFED